jgi:hypothetical protein
MKSRIFSLVLSVLVVAAAAAVAHAGYITRSEIKQQTENFKQWWDTDLEWRVEKLPVKGKVPKERMPYAGYIYPDKQGGCGYVLNKWDRAFNWGRGGSAAGYEQHDIASTKEDTTRRGGLFGLMTVRRNETPDWAGHCNGWVAAAIRHAEPQKSVVRNGVTFTPADIKSLLAEAYVYNDTVNLGGEEPGAVNPGLLHLILANWLGNGEHPLGMDSSVGKEVWNFPIYGYSSSIAKRGERQYEVRTNIGWVNMLQQEFHRAPRNNALKRLHYTLYVDSAGRIIGGDYMYDSDRIDMVWVPLHLSQGGRQGNQRGNPYLNAKELLAMWRESVPEERRIAYWNIDPLPEDAIHLEEEVDEQLAEESSGSDATESTETAEEEVASEATEESVTEEVAEADLDAAEDTEEFGDEVEETAEAFDAEEEDAELDNSDDEVASEPAMEDDVTSDEAAAVEADEFEADEEAAAAENEAEAADERAELEADEQPALETARSFSGRDVSERTPHFRR